MNRKQKELFRALAARHASELRVTWNPADGQRGAMHFMAFYNRSGIPGQGRKALREVLQLADELGVAIQVATSRPWLYEYFEGFGFVEESRHSMGNNYEARFYRRAPATAKEDCHGH